MFTLEELKDIRSATTWARIYWRDLANKEWDNDEMEDYKTSTSIANSYNAMNDRITDEIARMEKKLGMVV